MKSLKAIAAADLHFAINRLVAETGKPADECEQVYNAVGYHYERAKQQLTRPAKTQKRTATQPPPKGSFAPTKPLPASPPPQEEQTVRVIMLPPDYIKRATAEHREKREREEEDERLAIGYTITRAYDLCDRLARMAAEGRRTL